MSIQPPDRIDRFEGPWRFLSNFYRAEVIYNGISYPTAEHAFQAAKATTAADHDFIRAANGPAEAKRRGRLIKCREDWEEGEDGQPVKVHAMLGVQRAKYSGGPCRYMLLATGSAYLEEGNWWHDDYWGNCICPAHRKTPGANWLGRLLMQVREELRDDESSQSVG